MPPVVLTPQRQTALIVVVALIVALGLTASGLYMNASRELQASQNRVADLERRVAIQESRQEAGPTLADAMQIVPADSVVTGGSRISRNVFWVSGETVDDKGQMSAQSWAVDVPGGSAVLITQRDVPSDADVVTSLDPSTAGDSYVTIETQVTTETGVAAYTDAVDMGTGKLLASLAWDDGSRVRATKDGKTLDISLPGHLCDGHAAGSSLQVTHLETTAGPVVLPRPVHVECITDAFLGTIRPADLGMPLYARDPEDGGETMEFPLPGGETVTVDLHDLGASGVHLEDLP